VKANNLSENAVLQVGQKLVIARVFNTPTPQIPTPTTTPSPAPPTITPTVTATARAYVYPQPELLSPLPGSIFHGREAPIVLSWAAVTILAPDEWYIVHLFQVEEGDKIRPVANVWTKGTSWGIRPSLYPEASTASRGFKWDVIVGRESKTLEVTSSDEWIALSPPSRMSYFFWY
jgi:hypothetical protein